MTIATFDFSFPGLVRAGSCFLTIKAEPSRQPFVVCSQKLNYRGTSITNAVEIIAEKLSREILDGSIGSSGEERKVVDALKRCWAPSSSSRRGLRDFYGKSGARWIEHYPADPSFGGKDTFSEVEFDADDAPKWGQTCNAMAARRSFDAELIDKVLDVTRTGRTK